jgi:hypothetical protein
MMLLELLHRYLSPDDMKAILSSMDLETSGPDPALLGRLEMAFRGMPPKKALSHFPRSALLKICEDNGIGGHGLLSSTDEDLIRKISSRLLEKGRPKLDGRPWMR